MGSHPNTRAWEEGYHIKRTKKEDMLERMVKLGPKGQDECRRHKEFEVAGGLGAAQAPRSRRMFGAYLCPLGLYAALFHPAVECILNLQGLFKSEVPVVIFLHLVGHIRRTHTMNQ